MPSTGSIVLGAALAVLGVVIVALAIRRHRGGRHRAPEPPVTVAAARTAVGTLAVGSAVSSAMVFVSSASTPRAPSTVDVASSAPTARPGLVTGGEVHAGPARPAEVPASPESSRSAAAAEAAPPGPIPAPAIPAPRRSPESSSRSAAGSRGAHARTENAEVWTTVPRRHVTSSVHRRPSTAHRHESRSHGSRSCSDTD